MSSHEHYIPGLRFHSLTPLYDGVLRRFFPEEEIKQRVAAAAAEDGSTVLDIGSGTGTLLMMLRALQRGGLAAGVDLDAAMLARAQAKFSAEPGAESGPALGLVQASATSLPYAASAVDCAVSTLVFHHLTHDQKRAALAELYRVLRSGGLLVLADFGPRVSLPGRTLNPFMRKAEQMDDNVRGLLPQLVEEAGFAGVENWGCVSTIIAPVWLLRARKPPAYGAEGAERR